MFCPACERELVPVSLGELTVDACYGGCGGVWFDRRELRHVDEAHEPAGPLLLDVPRADGVDVDAARRRKCVRCADTVMMRRFSGPRARVEMDECPGCGSVWLDLGELAVIRSEFAPGEDRQQVVRELLRDRLAEVAIDSMVEVEESRRATSFFRRLLDRVRG